jgi:hypothetical protein
VVSPVTFGEYWSIVNTESASVICCQPAAPVVKELAPLFDHCCPFVSTIFMKKLVAAGMFTQKLIPVAPVKSL